MSKGYQKDGVRTVDPSQDILWSRIVVFLQKHNLRLHVPLRGDPYFTRKT